MRLDEPADHEPDTASEVNTAAEESWERLHRDTVKVGAIMTLGVAVAVAVPVAIGLSSGLSMGVALAWVIPGVVLLTIGGTVYEVLRLRFTRYRITDARLELVTGIVFKQRRSLARERIRSVDLTAHPLLRMFGLVRVKVGTGETGSGEGSSSERSIDIDSVTRTAGDLLRTELLRRGEIDDAAIGAGDSRLATWRPAWVRYAPLSFLTPTLAAALIGVIFQVADWFGRGGLPVNITMDLVDRYGPWPVLAAGVVVSIIAGAIGSLAFQAEAWWNHRLDREPGGTLRVQRGLLISRSLSLEEERIRGIQVIEPLGIRSVNAARLDVVAIGLKTQDQGSDLSTLVPAAPAEVIGSAAQAVIGRIGTTGLTGHPRGARGRRLRWAIGVTVVIALATAALLLLVDPSGFWTSVIVVAALGMVAWSFWVALDAYRSLGHAIDGDHLVARRGSVRRNTVYLRRSGIIGWRMRQSVFQRRLGLMTVEATTAAGSGHYATVDADEHEGLDFAGSALPGLLEPFLVRTGTNPGVSDEGEGSAIVPSEPAAGRGESDHGPRDENSQS